MNVKEPHQRPKNYTEVRRCLLSLTEESGETKTRTAQSDCEFWKQKQQEPLDLTFETFGAGQESCPTPPLAICRCHHC